MDVDLVPLNVCGVVFPLHAYDESNLHEKRKIILFNQGGVYFIINVGKGKNKICLVSTNQDNKQINSSRMFVFIFLRNNKKEYESIKINVYLEGYTK